LLYQIAGKRWLQTSPHSFKGLHNAITRRYEKHSRLIGVLLILASIATIIGGLAGFITGRLDFGATLALAFPIAVGISIGVHLFWLRSSHQKLLHNFTKMKGRFRRLIPEGDPVFDSIMFPAYAKYLTGKKRREIDIDAWQVLENYVREVLDLKEIIDMEIKHTECTELEAINLNNEYERSVLQSARVAGAKIAAILEIETGTFFDDRTETLKNQYRDELTQMLSVHEVVDREAKAILVSLG